MSTFTPSLNTTLSIVNAAAGVLNHETTKNIVDRGSKIVSRAARTGSAITAFSAQTTILSRAFVDESVMNEPVLPNVMRSVHEWYTAQILSALHLSQMVSDGRTVQDVMSVVQTGHNQRERSVLGNVITRRMGQESFLANYLGEPATESQKPFDAQRINDEHFLKHDLKMATMPEEHKLKTDLTNASKPNDMSVRSINVSDNHIGPMGQLMEVTLTNPNGTGQGVKVPVFIQMQPSIIAADVAPRFIDMNVAPTMWQRWTMYRAGEITFMKDFLLGCDMHRRNKTFLKDPAKANAFMNFLKTVAKKDKYALDEVTDKLGARQSSNLANSVMIFSEDTLAQAKVDSGIDLHKESDRQRYFRDTYTMIIVVLDPLHQRVTIYFNGLDGEINVSYNEFKPKGKDFNPQDFMAAMTAFSSGNISRMR